MAAENIHNEVVCNANNRFLMRMAEDDFQTCADSALSVVGA